MGKETSQVCEPVIKPHNCQDRVSFPGSISSPAGWIWCGTAGLKLPTRGAPPAGQDASRSISPPSCPAPSSSPLPSLSQQCWKRWTLSQEPFLMAGSLHEATRSWAQARPVLGAHLVGLLLTQLPRPLVPAGDQGSKAGLWPSHFGLHLLLISGPSPCAVWSWAGEHPEGCS